MRVIGLSELIALAIHNEDHAHRHERRRDDKNQNPAAQGLNHSSTGGSSLGIAERATLGKSWKRGGEQGDCNQCGSNAQERSLNLHLSSQGPFEHVASQLAPFPASVILKMARRKPCGSCRSTHIATSAGQKS